MKRYLSLGALLFIILFIVSCIDEIDLDINSDKRSVVINGLITDKGGESTINVALSPILGIGNDNILDPILGAQVVLKNSQNESFNYIESLESPGDYTAFLDIDINESYHIEITLPGGELIVSEPQSIPQKSPEIENLDFDLVAVETISESGNVAERETIELYATTSTLQENTFLRWRVKGEYQFVERAFGLLNPRNCFITDNLDFNNIVIAESSDFSDRKITNLPLVSTSFNDRFHIVYLFNVFQYSIHPEEYEYWKQVDQLINIDGTLFDPPPGVIFGNLTNTTNPDQTVQGYFSVASESFQRFFAVPSRKGYFIDSECFTRPGAPNPQRCVDCTTILNSTLERPDYWVF
tara:strand:- start:1142 stop:2197 length:1056 start_codon:yes stop_codon:yes gene_type:complete